MGNGPISVKISKMEEEIMMTQVMVGKDSRSIFPCKKERDAINKKGAVGGHRKFKFANKLREF